MNKELIKYLLDGIDSLEAVILSLSLGSVLISVIATLGNLNPWYLVGVPLPLLIAVFISVSGNKSSKLRSELGIKED